ncbi:unnamed protein product, partial [Ilex paraguariensis]
MASVTTCPTLLLVCPNKNKYSSFVPTTKSFCSKPQSRRYRRVEKKRLKMGDLLVCKATPRKSSTNTKINDSAISTTTPEINENVRRVVQITLWVTEGIYILWLFLLPYAP